MYLLDFSFELWTVSCPMSWFSAMVTVACGFLFGSSDISGACCCTMSLPEGRLWKYRPFLKAVDEEEFFDDEDVDGFFEDPADCEVECETEEVVCFTVSKRLSLM